MNPSELVDFSIKGRKLSPSRRYPRNKVLIIVRTKFDEILENLRTGHRTSTGRSNSISPPLLVDFDLSSSNPLDIQELLRDKLVNHHWLCEELASDISTVANELGFGRDGFIILTYSSIVVMSDPPPDEGLSLKVMRIVLLGKIGREELESLKTETESCSICLDNLSCRFFFETWFRHAYELFSCLPWFLSLGVTSTEKHLPYVSDYVVRSMIFEKKGSFKIRVLSTD